MKIKKFDSMNVIPFIDIMLVLLTIVLTFSTFIAQGRLDLQLPKSSTTEEVDLKLKELIIDRSGIITLEDKTVELQNLKTELASMPKTTNISIKADENTPFKTFVTVINIFKELKMEKISIVTELKK
ncbi:MAG: biopolymer transporter ExbD [Sulfurovaceae bacterium]